jgi:hypothetical protein
MSMIRNPSNVPWYALSPQNARSEMKSPNAFGVPGGRARKLCSRMFEVFVKLAPPSSGGLPCVSAVVAPPRPYANVFVAFDGWADATAGRASTASAAASTES